MARTPGFELFLVSADDYALGKLVALRSSLLVLGRALETEPPSTYDISVETLVIFIKSARSFERQVWRMTALSLSTPVALQWACP